MAGQLLVVVHIKNQLHRFFRMNELESPPMAPVFLRKLEAQLEVRGNLRSNPAFTGCGDDFFVAIARHLTVEFFSDGVKVATEGEDGDSMYFIIEGQLNIVDESTGVVIGLIGPGDYAGEMSVLLRAKRTKTLQAKGETILCVLYQDQLAEVEDEFGETVQSMRTMAQVRQEATDFHLELNEAPAPPSPKAALAPAGDHGHGHGGHAHAHGAHAHGVMPGVGASHGHSGHAHHGKHPLADEIMHVKTAGRFKTIAELTLLLNCFQCSYYFLHVAWVVVPRTETLAAAQALLHASFLIPAMFVMVYLSPVAAKYQCLLTNVLYRDDERIAEIHAEQIRVVEMRDTIRKKVIDP